jgi:hypothetical protein
VVDNAGNLYIEDADNFCTRKVSPDGTITTFSQASGAMALDASENLYLADAFFVSRVSNTGVLTTIAGEPTGTWGYSGDGSPATSGMLNGITGIAADSTGNVYVSDTNNNALRLLLMYPSPPPFGSFDTPASMSDVSGSVAFTGWALSSAGITFVDIWREPVSGEGAALVYIGQADSVTGTRGDVASAYPSYPENVAAGWGYLMLTNELPGGNGTFLIHAIAHDKGGNSTDLGVKTIIVDNKDATAPFGSIDTPGQGATVSGTAYVNFGWALTPIGKSIPIDGSTIWVYIDGLPIGHPVYNNPRMDIETLFPGYANSGGAVGYYYIDSTQLTNGLHTIAWSVTDNLGAKSGIGSRYFIVQN